MQHSVSFVRRAGRQPATATALVADGTTLLDAARSAGLPIASACSGIALCARCGLIILTGASALDPERDDEREQKRRNRIPAEQRLACRAGVHGAVTATASYW
ncbi:MAG TPA: 2Fe-2S iron-sulfur cluster-binding protein [Myxococcota bacterium]|jgi:ferredoxin